MWITIGIVALVLVLLVGSCALLLRDLGNNFGPAFRVVGASNGQIDSVHVNSFNGHTTITFQAAVGLDVADGPRLACQFVRPTLEGTSAASTDWVIVNRAGDVIASIDTPCP